MLMWHRRLHLIDHGAALYFHHSWKMDEKRVRDPFVQIKDHVLLPFASDIAAVDADMTQRITAAGIATIVAALPDTWLAIDSTFATPDEFRGAYAKYLVGRLQSPRAFVEEAIRARALHL
jgi:hypothetical protein